MIVKIRVDTVTPVYTGDAFGINEIKPQSIMGSLRFWFEVFLKAVGKLPRNYNYNTERIKSEKYDNEVLIHISKGNSLISAKAKSCKEIALPSQIFGCSGLKSKISVRNITQIKAMDYLNLQNKPPIKINGSKNGWPFPGEYFYGYFTIEFNVEDENILKDILLPLLNFIEKYGYLGGKNNLGFGRVKFTLENPVYGSIKDYDVFRLSRYGNDKDIQDSEAVIKYNNSNKVEKMYYINKIGLYVKDTKEHKDNEYFYEILKELINQKADLRKNFKDGDVLEHYIFGFTGNKKETNNRKINTKRKEKPNATKIIPWINEKVANEYEYGFISLTLLNETMIKKRRCFR